MSGNGKAADHDQGAAGPMVRVLQEEPWQPSQLDGGADADRYLRVPVGRRLLRFEAPGIPVPQGSKRVVTIRGRSVPVEMGKGHKAWRRLVKHFAHQAMIEAGLSVLDGAMVLACVFTFPVPPSHLTKKGTRRKGKPEEKIGPPDTSKLARAVEDSLTDARVWVDDSREIILLGRKRYELTPAELSVWRVACGKRYQGPQPGVIVEVYRA